MISHQLRLCISAMILLIIFPVPSTLVAAEKRPNFIIILADDLGYGDLSCYGNQRYETPHLDQLAKEGMRFLDFHSSGAVCSPTRAGLLTGRYQQRAGIPGVVYAAVNQNRHHGLHQHEVTFAELLQAEGYSTGIFGKWHLGYRPEFNPVMHGFDEFRGYLSGNVDYFSHVDQTGVYDWWHNREMVQEEGYSTHLITRHAVEFIEHHHDQPFCLYVAHEAPHYPYQGPNDKPLREAGQSRNGNEDRNIKIPQAYREMVQEMDKGVGDIIATLKKLELEQDTIVFFFSDNGATQRGSHGDLRGFKGSLWEGGHRVPAIAWWPGTVPANTICTEPTISIDIMPTILALSQTDVPSEHRLDGVSLLPALLREEPLPERMLFWSYRGTGAVRKGPWKLVIQGNRERPSLYNLKSDLHEQQEISAEHPEIAQDLLTAYREWEKDVQSGATQQPERPARD